MCSSNISNLPGFTRVGTWVRDASIGSGIRYNLQNADIGERRVVYAFVIGGEVMYIGVCQERTTTLANRLGRYQHMAGGGTNRRIAGYILQTIENGGQVDIYAWYPEEALEYEGINVDLVMGLENPLINRLNPQWNIHGCQ